MIIDVFGRPDAFERNVDIEYERNGERYQFLRWGQTAFDDFKVVPPGTGIVHQVNIEHLAKVIYDREVDGVLRAYPDTCVGTDSHTTMVNGLGVLGWGVGGIEAEAAMLGQPVSMLIPRVVGFKLTGEIPAGVTATDVVLTITDLRVRLLPDLVNWPGFVVGLFFSAIVPPPDGEMVYWASVSLFHKAPPLYLIGFLDGLLGAAFGSLLLWGIAALYKLWRGREGMGMGDVKMMAMVGAFLGLRGTFFTILFGTLLGSIVGGGVILALYASGWQLALAERASRRNLGTIRDLRWTIASQYQLPLGTFLGVAALLIVFLGPIVLRYFPGSVPL